MGGVYGVRTVCTVGGHACPRGAEMITGDAVGPMAGDPWLSLLRVPHRRPTRGDPTWDMGRARYKNDSKEHVSRKPRPSDIASRPDHVHMGTSGRPYRHPSGLRPTEIINVATLFTTQS